jgi:hypothetical protein
MAWRGMGGDTGIWTASSMDGIHWTEQERVQLGVSERGPTMCPYGDWSHQSLAMAFRGAGDDQSLKVLVNPRCRTGAAPGPRPVREAAPARP